VKSATLLLAGSLAANVVLLALYIAHPNSASAPAAGSTLVTATSSVPSTGGDSLRAALASGDVAALRAAGLTAEQAREVVLGRAFARVVARASAQQQQSAGDRWWSNKRSAGLNREEALKAQRELSDALLAAFGADPIFGGLSDSPALAFLPADKRAALRRITQDYDEMLAKFSADGFQLPSDREKQKLLQSERDRDIAALLSPDELAEYQMRTSSTATNIRSRYGDAITSDAEFRQIYALQKAFDDQYPMLNGRVTPEQMQQRAAAAQQLQSDLHAALGDEAYAALRRASDSDLRTVDALATRLNLPANTTDTVAALRDTYATQSQRISSDTAVPFADRRTQLQNLATQAKADLGRTLGSEGAEAYAQRSAWVSMLQGGVGFSTTPPAAGAAMSLATGTTAGVFPVPPAGTTGGGAVRQGFTFVTSDGASGGGGSAPAMIFAPADGQPRDGMTRQVISISTSSTEHTTSATPPATTGATPTPAQPAPAPKP
jgi:hypothetical protein